MRDLYVTIFKGLGLEMQASKYSWCKQPEASIWAPTLLKGEDMVIKALSGKLSWWQRN
jgi:hypothetical protein